MLETPALLCLVTTLSSNDTKKGLPFGSPLMVTYAFLQDLNKATRASGHA